MSVLTVAVAGADRAEAHSQALAARNAAVRGLSGDNGGAEAVALVGDAASVATWLQGRTRRAPTVVITPDLDAHSAVVLLRAGAHAVLGDSQPQWLVRHAAIVAAAGGVFLDPWVAHDVADLARPRRHNLRGVTGREQQVLVHAARGLGTRAIAESLGLSRDTVKGHLRSLQHRLGVSRRELIRAARAEGLLPSGTSRTDALRWDAVKGLEGLSVFVVGHERLPRETLARMLAAVGARVVGQGDGWEAVSAARGEWMTTVAASLRAGAELQRLRAARPGAALVVIPWNLTSEAIRAALAARAQGVVGVNARLDELLAALRAASSGGLYLDPAALQLLVADVPEAAAADGPLTSRQQAVLALVARGCTNREIARELGLAEPTVKGHLRSALRALGAHDRHEAAAIAARRGIIAATRPKG